MAVQYQGKVVVTGGTGLLGVNIAGSLAPLNNFTLLSNSRSISFKGIHSKKVNLGSIASIDQLLEEESSQLVIHCAALSSVEYCEANPEEAYYSNCKIAHNVAKVCARHSVKLVHISTDHLFRGDFSYASENTHPQPLNVYGKTKAQAENAVLSACPKALVVRTNFYGWGPVYRQSFSDSIISQLRAGNHVNLFTDVYYTPILMDELIEQIFLLEAAGEAGIFNVVSSEKLSKFEFGEMLATEFDLDTSLLFPVSIECRTDLVVRPKDMSLSNEKLQLAIGENVAPIESQIARLHEQESSASICAQDVGLIEMTEEKP